MKPSSRRLAPSLLALLVAPAALLAACGEEIHNNYHSHYYGEAGAAGAEPVGGGAGGEAGGAGGGAGEAGAAGAAGDPRYPDAPIADTLVEDQDLALFEVEGNRFYFAVSDAERQAMNDAQQGGGIWGPHYSPSGSTANYVDHLWVTTIGPTPQTADYGKVQVKVVGQSTRQPWDSTHIPNLNVDIDQFVEGQRIGGFEHLRFSNGQVGTIFRDRLAYDIYRALDYPAPLVSYVWVESNVWGPGISIPYILVERYKQAFCTRYADQFGGGCTNMWEFAGDFGGGLGGPKREADQDLVPGPEPVPGGNGTWDNPDNCQLDSCEGSRAAELERKIMELLPGEGFKAALTEYIDWPAFHRFQCLSWLLSTSDDPIHANNNVVLVERADGLFQYLPYSVDISLGFSDSGPIGLRGNNVLAKGCQDDPACWTDTLDTCEAVLAELEAIKPREMLLNVRDTLEADGMLRSGDDYHYQKIDDYLVERLASAPAALEQYRAGSLCELPQVDCDGFCQLPPCFVEEPPKPEPLPALMSYAVE